MSIRADFGKNSSIGVFWLGGEENLAEMLFGLSFIVCVKLYVEFVRLVADGLLGLCEAMLIKLYRSGLIASMILPLFEPILF